MNSFLNRQTTILGISFEMRDLVACACVALWILFILLKSGVHGLLSVGDAVLVITLLLLATSATRTVSWQLLLKMFSLGGFVMVLAAIMINMLFGSSGGQPRAIIVPIIEEIAFLAPAVFALWKRRAVATVLGASDIFLLFAVSGCGFALVEEACMRAKGEWGTAPIPFLPGCIVVGNRIFGEHLSNSQYIWAGLAGATIAFALFMRHRKKLAWQIALSGVVLGLIDHAVNNLRADARSSGLAGNFFLAPFTLVMLNGYLMPLLFIAAVIAVVVVDLKLIRSLPSSFQSESTGTLLQRWQTALDLRRMAYANYYCQHLSGTEKEQSETMVGFCFFRTWFRNKAKKEAVAS